MKFLLDTHLLVWAAYHPERIPAAARLLINSTKCEPVFSAASIWELAIKAGLGRKDFDADPRLLRVNLAQNGFEELPVTSEHASAVMTLPPIHGDPFDRLLIAQALVEGIELLTVDRMIAKYPAPIRVFGRG